MRLVRFSSFSAPLLVSVVFAAALAPAPAEAQIVRDHRTPSPAPAPALHAAGSSGGVLSKYTVEMLRSNPPTLALREPIISVQVEFRCPTCAPSASAEGVKVEVWFTGGGGSPKLVGVTYNAALHGGGGLFSVPAGSFPAAEGTFVVKLLKDNEVSSSSFSVVPTQLKIFGPTLRDHRTQ